MLKCLSLEQHQLYLPNADEVHLEVLVGKSAFKLLAHFPRVIDLGRFLLAP